ncbi:hypothetical protein A6R68_17664, partial [Neotoma lepida]
MVVRKEAVPSSQKLVPGPHMLGGECLLLAAMSYDRYVAICHPLRYPVLMRENSSGLMAAGARQKSLSTCSFHMVVVIMYYGPFIFTYMRPRSYHTPGQDKFLAIFYTILTPILNPMIYSFRNKDVLMAVKNIIQSGECLLLAAMSYDRYVAICHPLRYPVLMRENSSGLMAAGAWLVGILNSIVHTAFALHFPFCHSRAIDHFFCEVPAMLKLSCVDTSRYERGVYVSGIIFLLIPFSVISISYVQILLTVFQMQSSGARQKSLSTCSFHMVVVIMYYGPFIFTYMRPRSYHTPGQDKFLAIFYTILTPTFNPIIYSFRNKDVLMAMKNIIQRTVVDQHQAQVNFATRQVLIAIAHDELTMNRCLAEHDQHR